MGSSYRCPTCGNTVHKAAKKCLQCGRTRSLAGRITFLQLIGWGAVLAVAYAVAPSFWHGLAAKVMGGG